MKTIKAIKDLTTAVKDDAKEIWKKHKKKIIGGALIVAAGAATLAGKRNKQNEQSTNEENLIDDGQTTPTFDTGRDMTMKFIYDDDGTEAPKTVSCKESFYQDMVDASEAP